MQVKVPVEQVLVQTITSNVQELVVHKSAIAKAITTTVTAVANTMGSGDK